MGTGGEEGEGLGRTWATCRSGDSPDAAALASAAVGARSNEGEAGGGARARDLRHRADGFGPGAARRKLWVGRAGLRRRGRRVGCVADTEWVRVVAR